MSKPSRNIPKGLRNAVWNKYIGIHNADGPCWCKCGIIINITNFEVGHVQSFVNGGSTTLDNLRPICLPCNRSMGSKNMIQFMIDSGFISNSPLAETMKLTINKVDAAELTRINNARALLLVRIHRRIALDNHRLLKELQDKKAFAVMFDMFFCHLYGLAPVIYRMMFYKLFDRLNMFTYNDILSVFIEHYNQPYKEESLKSRDTYYFSEKIEPIEVGTVIGRLRAGIKKIESEYVFVENNN